MKCCDIFIITNGCTSSLLSRKMEPYTGIGQAAHGIQLMGVQNLHQTNMRKESVDERPDVAFDEGNSCDCLGGAPGLCDRNAGQASDGVHGDRQRVGKGPSRSS